MKEITSSNLREEITDELCLIDFYADWCGPCKGLIPVLEQLEAKGAAVYKVNIDSCSDLAKEFGVKSIPTVVVMKQKQPVDGLVGAHSLEAYQELIKKASAEEKENG